MLHILVDGEKNRLSFFFFFVFLFYQLLHFLVYYCDSLKCAASMQHQLVLALSSTDNLQGCTTLWKFQLWCLKTYPNPSLIIKPTNVHKTVQIPSHPKVVLPNSVSSEYSVDKHLYFKKQIQLSFIFSSIIRVK